MSIIAILGTALAIMMIMTIVVADEIKNASVPPEGNRYRTYYMDGHLQRDTANSTYASTGGVSYSIIHDYFRDLEVPEFVSVYNSFLRSFNVGVNISGKKESFNTRCRMTDAAYWKLMSFNLVDGRTYTQEEFESGIGVVVISQNKVREIFKNEEAINQTLEIDGKEYRIIGIVEQVPSLFKHATGDVWLPYTSMAKYENNHYLVAIMAKKPGDFPAIYAEIRNMEKKYTTQNNSKILRMRGPFNHNILMSDIRGFSEEEVKESIKVLRRKRILILAILLLVPALNLSGISLSRVKKRTAEIGVRKAFGAKKYVILIQVLYENFITSLIGGILGLIFSYIIVYNMKLWLLKLPGNEGIPINTLVSPFIFIAVFLVCVVLNLLSAGLPAFRASRISIINSINQNDR